MHDRERLELQREYNEAVEVALRTEWEELKLFWPALRDAAANAERDYRDTRAAFEAGDRRMAVAHARAEWLKLDARMHIMQARIDYLANEIQTCTDLEAEYTSLILGSNECGAV